MSTYDELLATVKVVRDRTGDPNAWQSGLTPNELTAVVTPTTRPEQLDAILTKIRQQHPTSSTHGRRPASPGASDREQGDAAEAIAGAEAALAHQNSASSQLDLQVISAIMNAHLKTVEGRDALTTLQRETEAAVQTRSDLDTPAGARDFQRFLIGKLRDIRAVVMNASLDDTSKSALMAAWTSLYDASKSGAERYPADSTPAAAAAIRHAGSRPTPVDDRRRRMGSVTGFAVGRRSRRCWAGILGAGSGGSARGSGDADDADVPSIPKLGSAPTAGRARWPVGVRRAACRCPAGKGGRTDPALRGLDDEAPDRDPRPDDDGRDG